MKNNCSKVLSFILTAFLFTAKGLFAQSPGSIFAEGSVFYFLQKKETTPESVSSAGTKPVYNDSAFVTANLLDFYPQKAEGNTVSLFWSLKEAEKKVTWYEIQKSHDAIEWKQIGRVQGDAQVSASGDVLAYSFLDNLQVMGNSFIVYYQLIQEFNNGAKALSSIRTVDFMYDFAFNSVSPNPFDKKLDIAFSTGSSRPVTISLIGTSGKTIARKVYKVQPGTAEVSLEAGKNLRPGMYILLMQQGKYRIKHKLIKKK